MACPILLAVGVALLLVSEYTGVAALRIVAVFVLLAGAIGGGISSGLAAEPPALLKTIAARFTTTLVRVIAVLLVLPAALGLMLAVVGAAVHTAESPVAAASVAAGAGVALALLAALAAALAVALRACRAATE
jgi:hypothetical protein